MNTTEIRTDLAIEVREASENDPVVATATAAPFPTMIRPTSEASRNRSRLALSTPPT
jgi:hypothetical protein